MSQDAALEGRGTEGRVLALLLLAYVFNFLDRQILSILKIPIKAELGLSDTQLGLMGGIAFASVYSTLAIPIARYADRKGRVRVVAAAVLVWSAFTALCATAATFTQLFLFRMGVGVGEAGGVAPSYALIAEHVPPQRRARAIAIFSLGIPIGSALGLFCAGWLAQAFEWRVAFVAIGFAGLPVALMIRLMVPERSGTSTHASEATEEVRLRATMTRLARKPSFWLLSLGSAAASICGYGLGFWLPSYFSATLGLSLGNVGSYFGSIVLVAGAAGIMLGGWLADRLGTARPAAYALVPAVAFLLSAPLFALALFAPSLKAAWILFALPYMLSLVWLGPILTAVQSLVLPTERATASAAFLLINNPIGIGFGTFIFGYLSDSMAAAYGSQALRYSILYGLAFYLVAAALYLVGARFLSDDGQFEQRSLSN